MLGTESALLNVLSVRAAALTHATAALLLYHHAHLDVVHRLVSPYPLSGLTNDRDHWQMAKAAGCVTVSGLDMFVGQAAEQFRLFTGLQPPVDLMRRVVLDSLR